MAYLKLPYVVVFCLWGLSASSCNESDCPLAWVLLTQRGDGICDLSCNVELCGFDGGFNSFSSSDCYHNCTVAASHTDSLGDSVCQASSDLNSEVCGWDAGDCGYCAPGCKAYIGFESDLGNKVCQEACDTHSCAFDAGDCVHSIQGLCSSGCFQFMLEDQVCQFECLVKACLYDNGACDDLLCAAGCYPDMQGDGMCNSECYLEGCNWDLSDCDCANGCHADMLGNGICESACNQATCDWDMNDCQCSQGCSYSEIGTGKAQCIVPACNFDAWNWPTDSCISIAALSCEVMCSNVKPNQLGLSCTKDLNCHNKTVPFTATYCENSYTSSSIYPVNTHLLPDISSAIQPVVYYVISGLTTYGTGSREDPFQSLQQAFNQANQRYVDLLLFPGTYSASVAHIFSSCQIVSTVLMPQPRYFPSKRVRVASADCREWLPNCKRPVLQLDVIYKCITKLPENLTLEYSNVVFTTAEGTSSLCGSFGLCPPTLFSVPRGSLLSFTNVTFQRLPSVPVSVISLMYGKLDLSNVDFVDISLNRFRTGDFKGIISSNSSAEIAYRRGRVSLLNNGIDYRSNYFIKGFLLIQQGSVVLEGVQFSYNYMGTDFALIAFAACDRCVIGNCTFENNLGTVIKYAPVSLKAFSSDWQEAKAIAGRSLQIENCVFRNNTGYGSSSVVVQFASIFHLVIIQNCSFTNEYAESVGVLFIASSSFNPSPSEGFWQYVYSRDNKPYKVFYPAAHISLQNLTFTNCTVGSYGLLHITQLPRLHLSNIAIQGYGAFGNVTRFTNTLNAFTAQPSARIPLYLTAIPLSPCLSVVNITHVQDFVVDGFLYEQLECYYGLYLANSSKGWISGLRSRGNIVSGANGAVLFFNFSARVIFSEIVFIENKNERLKGQGIIQIAGSNTTISLRNGQFERNKASNGGVLYCSSAVDLSIENSTFSNNIAESGGVLHMELPASLASFVHISASVFKGNTAAAQGGVLAFTLEKGSSTLYFLISNCTILENSSVLGSVLYISKLIWLEQGLVSDSLVGRNSATEIGTFHLTAGNLSLENTVFEGNSAQDGSVIYRDCSIVYGLCALSCSNVSLVNNTGAAVISLLPSFQLQSFVALHLLCSGNSATCLSFHSTIAECHYCEFRGNTASLGSGFALFHSNLTMSHSHSTDNVVEGDGGVGVLLDASFLHCQLCEFVNNTANRQGGALYLKDSDAAIINSDFSRNKAREGGFALSLYRSLSAAKITNTRFSSNSGEGIGVISLLLANMNLTSCLIADNQYFQLTGGISLYLSDLSIHRCEFRNQSSYSGTFLYISQSSVLIESSSFRGGRAFSSGGAAAIVASTVELRNTSLSKLTAELGAAIFLQNEAALTLDKCELRDITVGKTDRGVINGYRSIVYVLNSSFSNFTQSAISGEEIELSLFSSSFQQAVGNNGGAVSCLDCRRVHISASTFRNLSAVSRGGALYIAGNAGALKGVWTVENSMIEGCEAPEGGAMLAENCSMAITGNVLVSNKAQGNSGQGGAMQLSARSSDTFEVKENTFKGNSAGLKGGGICWKGSQPSILNNSYANNSAQYGDNIASFAIQLALLPKSPASLSNYPSGQSGDTTLTLELLDHYEQRVTSDNFSYAILNSPNNATSFAGTTQVLANMGLFSFSSFSIISPPGLNTSISIFTTALTASSSVRIPVHMRKCIMGEAESNAQCVPCAFGSYSLIPSTSCKNCPAEAYCYGNFSIGPRAGYWQASNLSDLFISCPYAAACRASSPASNMTGQCAEGYEGNMCQICSVGYFRWSRVRCSQCLNSAIRIIGKLILWIIMTLLLIVLVKLSLNAGKPSNSLSSIALKILLNYLQLVMLFDSFNLAWPDLMLQLFNAQEAVGGFPEFLFSFNCLYANETELQVYERKLIVLSLLQPLLVAVSTSVLVAIALCRRSLGYLKNEAIGSGIALFFLAFPSVMRTMLGALHCKEVLPGEYWVVGLDMRCWDSYHLKYAFSLAVPSLILWGLGVPALVYLCIHRQKRQSNEIDYKVRYGFLITGYQQGRFYWEYVVIYRKLLIIAFVVFFAQVSLFLQALSTLGILLVSVTLQSFLQPYSQAVHNSLEQRSLTVATLTLYSGLLFYHETLGKVGETLMFGVISTLNLAFTVFCLADLGLNWKRSRSIVQVSTIPLQLEVAPNPTVSRPEEAEFSQVT